MEKVKKAAYPFRGQKHDKKRKEAPPWERVLLRGYLRQEQRMRCWRKVIRQKVREFIQELIEEEVTVFLGRRKSERIKGVDGRDGYRNGYGKPRKLSLLNGTIMMRRPRVRGTKERFESRVLPLFTRGTKEVGESSPELYLHGLAKGDFDLAFEDFWGRVRCCRRHRFSV